MIDELHAQCMRLLLQAQAGNEDAHRRLVDIVSKEYSGMIQRFYTHDPIMGREDIESEFYWGIWRGVKKDDGRGDRIFYLAQCGEWSVKSLVTAVNRRRHGTVAKEGGMSVISLNDVYSRDSDGMRVPDFEVPDESPEADLQGVVEIHEDRQETSERVLHILVNANLAPKHKEIVELILSGEVDTDERFPRHKLAQKLGVSGQRISQLMDGIAEKVEALDI